MSENTEYLGRAAIFAEPGYLTEVVEVPEWGGKILVRELSGAQVEQLGLDASDPEGNIERARLKGYRAKIIVWASIDAEGKPIFHKNDIDRLNKRGNAPLQRISAAVMRLSGMIDEEGEPVTEVPN